MFILSALIRLPFPPAWLVQIKPLLIWIAFSAQWRLTKRIASPDKKNEIISAFMDQASKLKLSTLAIHTGVIIISAFERLRVLRFKTLPAIKTKLIPANHHNTPCPSFYSEDSQAFSTLKEAGVAAAEWYQKVNDSQA